MQQLVARRRRLLPALEAALGAYDDGTARHSARVGGLAADLGRALGLGDDLRAALGWAGALHDVGKLAVPEAILQRDGPLTAAEWDDVRRHPDVGADLLLAISPELQPVSEAVRAHHERWDGTGYPNGVAGASIPVLGRILAVADAYDSMISTRPYRRGIGRAGALAELRRGASTQFDPAVVAAFGDLVAGPPAPDDPGG